MTESTSKDETYVLRHHLVAFLDILGQRELFRQLRLPRTADEHLVIEGVLKDTVGFIVGLRKHFLEQFEAFEAGVLGEARIPEQERGGIKLFRPAFMGFSDSFIASVPFKHEDGPLTRPLAVGATTLERATSCVTGRTIVFGKSIALNRSAENK